MVLRVEGVWWRVGGWGACGVCVWTLRKSMDLVGKSSAEEPAIYQNDSKLRAERDARY